MTSTHPEFAAAGSFAHMPLGKLAPKHDPRTLQLARYIDDAALLPQIPPAHDWTAAISSWPMYGNDRLGDCTCAAAGHMIQAWSAAAGAPATPAEVDVLAAYWATGQGDTGRVELDVLNFWHHHGVGADKITAYAAVDLGNVDHVKAAIYLFGGVYTGIALPKTAQAQQVWDVVGDGKTGDSEPGSWGGHAVPYEAYDADGVELVTWGATLRATWAFHSAYCDEGYAIVSRDFLDGHHRTPAGFNLAALRHDLALV